MDEREELLATLRRIEARVEQLESRLPWTQFLLYVILALLVLQWTIVDLKGGSDESLLVCFILPVAVLLFCWIVPQLVGAILGDRGQRNTADEDAGPKDGAAV